jgi:hypothetical protein
VVKANEQSIAIATTTLPYWVGAAMRGSAVGFNQLKASDTPGTMNHLLSALGGSIVLAAGRVLYGWISKIPSVSLPNPPQSISGSPGGTAKQYTIYCDGMDPGDEIVIEASSPAAANSALANVQSNSDTECCFV